MSVPDRTSCSAHSDFLWFNSKTLLCLVIILSNYHTILSNYHTESMIANVTTSCPAGGVTMTRRRQPMIFLVSLKRISLMHCECRVPHCKHNYLWASQFTNQVWGLLRWVQQFFGAKYSVADIISNEDNGINKKISNNFFQLNLTFNTFNNTKFLVFILENWDILDEKCRRSTLI